MASWTDKNPPKFNPYIQQLPVEEMMKVGMQKQSQYNQGIEKIQTQIDTIAGMDIARGVDKTYLQSKLNELGNNLKTVAAGDFSNFQLVNSVNGMTNRIAKDENVINAVSSTQRYKKEVARLEKAKENGKSAIENEWAFGVDANDWLSSTDISKGYNGSYNEYIDVNKKWLDVMKSLHPDLLEKDFAFVTENGKINYNKTAAAMQRVSKETISKEKIENALRSSLTPSELNQLSISGRYQFKDYTPDDLANYATSSFTSKVKDNENLIKEWEAQLKLGGSSILIKNKAKQAIDALTNENINLEQSAQEQINLIKENPDVAKLSIYKNEAIKQFSHSFAWETNKEHLLTNPVRQDELEQKKYNLAVNKFRLDERIEQRHIQEAIDKKDSEGENKQNKKNKLENPFGTPGVVTDLGKDTKFKDPYTNLLKDSKTLSESSQTQFNDLLKQVSSLGINQTQLNSAIDRFKGFNKDGKKIANTGKNWYELDGGKSIPLSLREQVINYIKTESKFNDSQESIDLIENEAINSKEVKEVYNKILTATKNLPTINITEYGKTLQYSQKDIVNMLSKSTPNDAVITSFLLGGTGYGEIPKSNSYSKYTAKEMILLNSMKKDIGMSKIIGNYRDTTISLLSEVKTKKHEVITKLANERFGAYLPKSIPAIISTTDGGTQRQQWEAAVSSSLKPYENNFQKQKGGNEFLTEDNIKSARKLISSEGKSNILYNTVNVGNQSYIELTANGNTITIPTTEEISSQLPKEFKPTNPEVLSLKDKQRTSKTGRNSSNFNTIENAYMHRWDLPLIEDELQVGVNFEANSLNDDKQYVTFILDVPGVGEVHLPYQKALTTEKAIQAVKEYDSKKLLIEYLESDLSDETKRNIILSFGKSIFGMTDKEVNEYKLK